MIFFQTPVNILDILQTILGGANNGENTNNSKNDSDAISNESSILGKRGTENIGLAVFYGDKLVGELNAMETLCHLINTNDVSTFIISIPDPNDNTKNIDLSITPKKKTKTSVDVSNGSPYISVDISLEGHVLTIDDNVDYLDEDNLNTLASYANSYLESNISNYLYKTSKELKSDIDAFGKYAVSAFLTENDWINYDWINNYKDAFFNVNVNTDIKSSLLLTET